MKTSVTLLLTFCAYRCAAQLDSGEDCPPTLYIKAGGYGEFINSNANSTYDSALISFLGTESNQTVAVQQGNSVCGIYPLIHISIPANTPVGTAKITWPCDNEKPNPCPLMFVQPASPSSSSSLASELVMNLECPSSEAVAISETNTPYQTHLTSAPGQVHGSGTPTRGGSPGTASDQNPSEASHGLESDANASGDDVPKLTKSETNLYTGNSSPASPTGSGIHSIPSGPSNNAISTDGAIQTAQPTNGAVADLTRSSGLTNPTGTPSPISATQAPVGSSGNTAANKNCTCALASA